MAKETYVETKTTMKSTLICHVPLVLIITGTFYCIEVILEKSGFMVSLSVVSEITNIYWIRNPRICSGSYLTESDLKYFSK